MWNQESGNIFTCSAGGGSWSKKEVEEFRAQVECLNMPPPAVIYPTKELCTEEMTSDPAAQTEKKTEGQKDWEDNK